MKIQVIFLNTQGHYLIYTTEFIVASNSSLFFFSVFQKEQIYSRQIVAMFSLDSSNFEYFLSFLTPQKPMVSYFHFTLKKQVRKQ